MEKAVISSNGVPAKQPANINSGIEDKMPPGKGRYTIGRKNSYGCKGYPVVGGEGTVHGCHTTRGAAIRQQAAIYASQNQQKMADTLLELAKMYDSIDELGKSMDGSGDGSHDCPCAGQQDCQCDDPSHNNDGEDHMMGKADVSVGDMVSWNSSGGSATGRVTRIIRNGAYNVPNSDFTITGTQDDPAVAIRVYRNGEPTDTIVGHKMSTLRRVGKSMDSEDVEKKDYTPEQRRAMANRGQAMPDGSFPIANRTDLANAIQSVGRASNYAAARRHIISRARDLNAIDMLPEDWNVTKSLNGLFKNMPSSAKRVNTTGNAQVNLNLFKGE